MKVFRGSKDSVFISWFISYVLILFVPIVISAAVFLESMKIIEDEINKAHSASLNQLQQVMDGRLRDIEELSLQIAWDERIIALMHHKDELGPYQILNIYNIRKNLKTIKIANNYLDDLYIYFENNNFVVSENGKYDADNFFNFFYNVNGVSIEDWLEMVQGEHRKDYMKISRKTDQGIVESAAYVQSLPIEEPYLTKASLVMLIDENTLLQALQGLKWISRGTVFIIDPNNDVIASTKTTDTPVQSLLYDDLNGGQGMFDSTVDGKDVIVSYISSGVTGWKYVSVLPKDVFFQNTRYMKVVVALFIIACLLIGGTVAYYFTRRNYNPIQKLILLFMNKTGNGIGKSTNEYNYIEKSIIQVFDEKERISDILNQQKETLKNNLISRLLKGKVNYTGSLHDMLSSHDINFKSGQYAVLLFYIDDLGEEFVKGLEADSENLLVNAHIIIKGIIQKAFDIKDGIYITEIDDMLACIVNSADLKEEESHMRLIQSVTVIRQSIEDDFGISVSVSISGIHTSVKGIKHAYLEAIEAIEYNIMMGNSRVIEYDEISAQTSESRGSNIFLEFEQKFVNCIRAGDFANAKMSLNKVLDDDIFKIPSSLKMMKCQMSGLVNTMINAINEISVTCDTTLIDELDPIERLLNCTSVRDTKKQMNYIFDKLDEHFKSKNANRLKNLKDDVVKFIEDNYQDINLSVFMLANNFDVSEPYLSKYFKKEAGIGLLDYIHRTRIRKSKELIKETNLNIKDIAEMVGYNNSVAFIRAFKKYEGITPGKFKEI